MINNVVACLPYIISFHFTRYMNRHYPKKRMTDKKTLLPISIGMLAALCLAACSGDDPASDISYSDISTYATGSTSVDAVAEWSDVATFDISVDETALSETEIIDADDEDYLENNTFDSLVYVAFSGSSATVSNLPSGVTASIDGAHVEISSTIKGVQYVASGSSTDGQLKIYSEKKYQLTLNGLTLTNTTGSAINLQSGKRAYVCLADGTTNTLTDAKSYSATPDDEDEKAALFCEGKLLFSGTGVLNVNAQGKEAVRADDYILFRPGVIINAESTADHAIKANDGIYMRGGVVNATTSAEASKAVSSDSLIVVSGGRLTAITTGNGAWDNDEGDVKGSAGLKADYGIEISGGSVLCKSTGKGGKGISADTEISISGGTVRVITTGSAYSYSNRYSTNAKGIKADGNLQISGGDVMVRCTGGEGSEGIESKKQLTLSGGTVVVYAYDDAVNASSNITLAGGSLMAWSGTNDGVDSNGTLTVTGGTAIAIGSSSPEEGFDCDQNTFTITGGTIVGLGSTTSTPTSSKLQQCAAAVSLSSVSAGSTFLVACTDGTEIASFTVPKSISGILLVSSPLMTTGSSYTATAASSTKASWTQSSMLVSSSSGNSGGMGGMGGGGWR